MFTKQPIMRKVLLALSPILLFSIWLYGPRVVYITALSVAVCAIIEVLFEKKQGKKASEAVFVTALLFALSMPPLVPLWIVAIGAAFSVFMAKEVFGGFGRNIFNPAISGRIFVYVSFAGAMGKAFIPGGNFGTLAQAAVTAATPLVQMSSGVKLPITSLLTGIRNFVPGTGLQTTVAGGAIGESSIVLIVLAALFLIFTKTAQWRLMVSTLAGAALLQAILVFSRVPGVLPLESLLAGSLWFVAVFMSTDPVSAPKKPVSQFIYGFLIGLCVVVIRNFSAFPEGTSFAVLIGNTCTSLIDKLVVQKKAARMPAGATK